MLLPEMLPYAYRTVSFSWIVGGRRGSSRAKIGVHGRLGRALRSKISREGTRALGARRGRRTQETSSETEYRVRIPNFHTYWVVSESLSTEVTKHSLVQGKV